MPLKEVPLPPKFIWVIKKIGGTHRCRMVTELQTNTTWIHEHELSTITVTQIIWKCVIWVCMPLKSHTHLWGLLHLYSLCQQFLAHSPPAVMKQLQLPTCHDRVVGPPQMESYMLQTLTLHIGVELYTFPCFCSCGLKNNPVSLGSVRTFIRNKGTWGSFVGLCSHHLCSVYTLRKLPVCMPNVSICHHSPDRGQKSVLLASILMVCVGIAFVFTVQENAVCCVFLHSGPLQKNVYGTVYNF